MCGEEFFCEDFQNESVKVRIDGKIMEVFDALLSYGTMEISTWRGNQNHITTFTTLWTMYV